MSELDVQHILTKAATVTNISERGRLKQKATRYLTAKEVEAKTAEAANIRAMLSYQGPGANQSSEGKVQWAGRVRNLEDDIEANSPEPLTVEQKNVVYARKQQLEGFIREGMLTVEEMRRNPVTAVDRHIKWDKAKKAAVLEWKNLCRLLEPNSDEQDLANVERLRPTMATSGMNATSTFMPEAQIPGVFAMTPLAKQNWPEGLTEYPATSPLMQAADKEKEELRARLAALEKELEDLAPVRKQRENMLRGLAKARATREKSDKKRMEKELLKMKAENEQKAKETNDQNNSISGGPDPMGDVA